MIHNVFRRSETSGGDAISAGGFGCVFKPPLKCENPLKSQKYNSNGVSKLMYTEDAISELDKMDKINVIIKNIFYYMITTYAIHHH